jgi:hypothetical protein
MSWAASHSRLSVARSDGGDFLLILGIALGLLFFFFGFRIYRQYRVLLDTPEVAIAGMALGLVEIRGKAQGEKPFPSPVTKTPCFFYKVVIEKWETDSNGRSNWQQLKTDADGVKFYLVDATGKVLVDAHKAEYDLPQSARREIDAFGRTKSEEELASYVGSVVGASDPMLSGHLTVLSLSDAPRPHVPAAMAPHYAGSASGRYRLTEFCIQPDHLYDVTGTYVENPEAQDEHDRHLITKGVHEPTYLISWRSEKEIEAKLRRRAALLVFGGAAVAIVCMAALLYNLGWL